MPLWYRYLPTMRRFTKLAAVLSLTIGFLASCTTLSQGAVEELPEARTAPTLTLDEPARLEEILYVSGLGRRLATVGADGSEGTELLESESFPGFRRGVITAHSWSPSGDAVVAAVHLRDLEGERLEALYVAREGEREVVPVYTSEEVAPFYLYWNPNGEELSFIGGDGTGALFLYVVDLTTGEATLAHRGTRSLYWTWSGTGETLVTHTGGSLEEGRGTLRLHTRQSGSFDASVLTINEQSAGKFQVPDIADSGGRIAVALRNPQGTSTVAILNGDGSLRRRVANFDGAASLAWSPDGRYLAYVEGNRRFGGGIVGTLNVVDTERVEQVVSPAPGAGDTSPSASQMVRLVSAANVQAEEGELPSLVLSYFWAPDSSSILYFEPRYVSQGGNLQIFMEASLWDPEAGESDVLGSFRPADEFLRRILPFYDQYARSSSVWAPSSRRIVFNGVNEQGRQAIFVLDLDNREAGTREVAEGVVPLWRP